MDKDPKLHLVSPEAEMKILGSFAARKLSLFALCAQRNREGTLDLVAHDFEHLYYWQGSSLQPTMQFGIPHPARDARFLAADAGSPVAVWWNRRGLSRPLHPRAAGRNCTAPRETDTRKTPAFGLIRRIENLGTLSRSRTTGQSRRACTASHRQPGPKGSYGTIRCLGINSDRKALVGRATIAIWHLGP